MKLTGGGSVIYRAYPFSLIRLEYIIFILIIVVYTGKNVKRRKCFWAQINAMATAQLECRPSVFRIFLSSGF